MTQEAPILFLLSQSTKHKGNQASITDPPEQYEENLSEIAPVMSLIDDCWPRSPAFE